MIALKQVLKLSTISSPSLFFFFKIVLVILGPLCFLWVLEWSCQLKKKYCEEFHCDCMMANNEVFRYAKIKKIGLSCTIPGKLFEDLPWQGQREIKRRIWINPRGSHEA